MATPTPVNNENELEAPDFREIVAKLTEFAGAAQRILQRVSNECFDAQGKLDTTRLLMLIPRYLLS
jgi:hypothetical protein